MRIVEGEILGWEIVRGNFRGKVSRELFGKISGEKCSKNVLIPVEHYKSLRVAVMVFNNHL